MNKTKNKKIKVNFVIRKTTKNCLAHYSAMTNIYPGALIDLIFSDEILVQGVIERHMEKMSAILKNHIDK